MEREGSTVGLKEYGADKTQEGAKEKERACQSLDPADPNPGLSKIGGVMVNSRDQGVSVLNFA